jgi:hypothetical protein
MCAGGKSGVLSNKTSKSRKIQCKTKEKIKNRRSGNLAHSHSGRKSMKCKMRVLCLLAFTAGISASPEFKVSGDLQYRLRFEQNTIHEVAYWGAVADSLKRDYSNRYAWNLKATVNAAENLVFGIRLSNPLGPSTDNIVDNLKSGSNGGYNLLTVPEFYFKWSYSLVSLGAGIIPVRENTVLNLAVYENKGYKGAGADPWSNQMNNSQKGIFLEARWYERAGSSFGLNLVWASAADSGASLVEPAEQMRRDQFRIMASAPFSQKELKLSVMPIFHVRTNIAQAAKKLNHAYAAGLDLGVTPVAMIDTRAGFAYGFYKNSALEGDTAIEQIEPSGLLGSAGCTIRPGFGTVLADFTYGQSEEKLQAPGRIDWLLFADIKYGMPFNKLTIMPRFRVWYYANTRDESYTITLRPEMILKAGF